MPCSVLAAADPRVKVILNTRNFGHITLALPRVPAGRAGMPIITLSLPTFRTLLTLITEFIDAVARPATRSSSGPSRRRATSPGIMYAARGRSTTG